MAPKRLTDAELELMTILWRCGDGSVKDVLQELPTGRELAYTSVSTILRILEKKGAVTSRKEGRTHVYVPLFSKDDYERATFEHLVRNVFEDKPVALISRFIDSAPLDEQDLRELREILERKATQHDR